MKDDEESVTYLSIVYVAAFILAMFVVFVLATEGMKI
jgi:hypothetical protein